MKADSRVLLQKLADRVCLVSREVIEDDVNLQARGAGRNDLTEEADECTASLLTPSATASLQATPMRGTIARLLASGGQDPRPQSRCQYAGSLSGMKGVEAVEAVLKKTLLPANDRRCGGLQSLLDGAEGRALDQQQDQVWRETRIPLARSGAGLSHGSQFRMLIVGKQEFVASRHTNLEAQRLVMVTLRQTAR